jgi:hypothetical protein
MHSFIIISVTTSQPSSQPLLQVRESATDVLVALVRHPLSDKHPRLMKALVPAANAFAVPFRDAVECHDHDAAAEFARFALLLADNHIKVSPFTHAIMPMKQASQPPPLLPLPPHTTPPTPH